MMRRWSQWKHTRLMPEKKQGDMDGVKSVLSQLIRNNIFADEAHYMLGFKNKPLQNLIAVGRNKGMSVILATQNMDSFKSKHFDFYANAQYPLIMKQQQQNDGVLKDLFGVSGIALQELKQAIAGLQKGELITKDNKAIALGLGKHWKKIKVTRF